MSASELTLALAQMNPTVGDLAGNAQRIIALAQQAASQGADLLLTPEMALVGYPPEDLILIPAFRDAAREQAEHVARACADLRCDILLGSVWEQDGHVYNASLLASGGVLSLARAKHDLPNYGVFDEKRVFHAGGDPQVVLWRGRRLGLLICEEVWEPAHAHHLAEAGAELLLVQNASPYHRGKARERKQVVSAACAATGLPLIYVNLVGGQDELVFDGRSYAVDAQGQDVCRLPAFSESLAITRWQKRSSGWQCLEAPQSAIQGDEATIYGALVLGLRDYVGKNRFPGVVLGLSGGIDSGLSAAIAADALGAEALHGVRLPSPFTSRDSMEDSQALAAACGLRLDTLPITPLMERTSATLADIFGARDADTTEENIQARLRGLLVMAISNKLGPLVLTTGNKSELSVGYATLYGDMCGGYSVLKDVYKTTVFALARWRNTLSPAAINGYGFCGPAGTIIPPRMIEKPPTAELRPNQRDDDSLPPYDVLDAILEGLIERRLSVAELAQAGHDIETVRRVARLLAGAEYKRRQSAPGVKITPMAFGRDRRLPITNAWRFE